LATTLRYAEKVKRYLYSFFLDPATGMNPNLLHAQVYGAEYFPELLILSRIFLPRAGQAKSAPEHRA
jgi:hypothetical protein